MFDEDTIDVAAKSVDLTNSKAVGLLLERFGTELRGLKDDKAERDQRIERMAADLKAARQEAAEHRVAANRATESFGSDNELRFYSEGDGKIRLYSTERQRPNGDTARMPGLLDDANCRTEWQRDFQKASDAHVFATLASNPGKDYTDPRVRHHPGTLRVVRRLIATAPAPIKRAFDGGSGSGAEFIPAPVMPELLREVEVRSGNLSQLFEQVEISSSTQTIPVINANPKPFIQGAFSGTFNPGAFLGDSLGTDERTITPTRLAILTLLEDNATEDSIFDVVALHRQQVAQSIAWGKDDCVMNGDTAASHQDTGLASWDMDGIWTTTAGGSRDHRKAWLGLRALAFDNSNTVDRSSFDEDAFKADVAAIAKPRGMDGDRICVTSEAGMLRAISTMESIKSAEKYGSREVVLTGEVARAHGVRFIISDFMSEQLNASGVYDNTTKTKTAYALFNRRAFRFYVRRGTRVELQRDATIGGSYVVASWRGVFKMIRASGTKAVRYGFNI